MRRTAAGALLGVATVLSVVVSGVGPATAAKSRPLYVYGHSYTNGVGLADKSKRYTHLVAAERGYALHSFGVNGSLVHKAAERLYGTGRASWKAGRTGDALIQANINTARDFGANPLALATSQNSMRVMLATINASRRIEDSSSTHHYGGAWHTKKMSWASGGSVHVATRNKSYVQFKALGGEYVSFRGVAGKGITLRLRDLTTGRIVARLSTGKRVHPEYSHYGIPVVYRLPTSLARHTIRLTKLSGTGSFFYDARLPQRRSPGKVILVKEPHLAKYSLSRAHPNGSNTSIDAFNHILDTTAREFRERLHRRPQRRRLGPDPLRGGRRGPPERGGQPVHRERGRERAGQAQEVTPP